MPEAAQRQPPCGHEHNPVGKVAHLQERWLTRGVSVGPSVAEPSLGSGAEASPVMQV